MKLTIKTPEIVCACRISRGDQGKNEEFPRVVTRLSEISRDGGASFCPQFPEVK